MPEVSRKQASRGALSLLFGVDNDVGREGQPKYIGRGRTVSIYGVVWVERKDSVLPLSFSHVTP
jgi:hypothetical protein